MTETTTANPDQAAKWNDRTGRTWAELGDILDRVLEPFVPLLLNEIEPVAGRRILDVGCGAGAVTLAAAGRGASALGVDISAPLIEAARERAERSGAAGAEFAQADAQAHDFQAGRFEALVSRFGVMFFADPAEAFRNLRSAVRPGGRLAFVAWRSPAENGFMTAAERSVEGVLQLPERVEGAPGQFGFADSGRVSAILAQSGWTGVEIRPVDVECRMTRDELRLYARRMGPVADLLPALDEARRTDVERRIDAGFKPYLSDGKAQFTAACWKVTASA
ncbi:MAG TPA: class I SAM-dependent methyltransferase [Allosphingosinicella sp.]|nr:class I SAM-dependent methyltransferase [Allosphingosinicella sp.]